MMQTKPVSTMRHTVMAAALGLAGTFAATQSHAQTPIKFSLDWKFEGPLAPFVVALDKGYFKAEGLDVTLDTGSGSVEPLNRLASGSYDMAVGDINSLIKFLDKNKTTQIKAVFMYYNNPPFAVVGRKSLGINSPKDLEGKKLGAPAQDGAYAQWPIFVAENKIDASKVQIQNIGFPVREPMLVSGEVSAITGFAFSSYLNVAKAVPAGDATVFLMSDFGVKLYGNTVMVHPKFAAEKPEAVKGFLRALLKGIKDTVANPDAAVASIIKRNDVAKKDVELERLKYALDKNILTKEVMANGFGAVDMKRMGESIDQLAMTYSFDKKPVAAEIFDASFLPAAGDRAAK
jgi:NitT/TauT family transport system substrate-binding protein